MKKEETRARSQPCGLEPSARSSGLDALRAAAARFFFGETPLAVANSLRREPYAWTAGEPNPFLGGHICYLFHASGLRVWRQQGGSYAAEVSGLNVRSWGGVTTLSAFGLSPGHRLIHHAANQWVKHWGPATANRSISDLLQNAPTPEVVGEAHAHMAGSGSAS